MSRFIQAIGLVVLVMVGTVSAAAGETIQRVVGGQTRTALIERPAEQGPRPTIIMLHMADGTAAGIARESGLAQLASRQGFVAVFPQALLGRWNLYPTGKESAAFLDRHRQAGGPPDDVGFLRMLVADLVRQGVTDPKRVYLAGSSNGGFMTLRMLCVDAGTFAAIGVLISAMPEATASECRPAKPTPAIIIKGTADRTVPYEGGVVATSGGQVATSLGVWPTERLVGFLRTLNGCTEPAQHSVWPGQHSQKVEIERSAACSGAPVVLYRVVGGGHEVPAALNAVLWDFFRDKVRGDTAVASGAPSGPAPPDTRDVPLAWVEPGHAPAASPKGKAKSTHVTFVNRRAQAVSIEWVGFDGGRKHFADVRPGLTHRQPTYAGHVWVVVEGGQILGVVVAGESPGRVEIDAPSAASGISPPRAAGRETRVMSAWTVHVSTALLGADAAATTAALQLLQAQLEAITRVVPKPALAELQKVPLWISPEYPGTAPKAEYHPDAGWLRQHGRDPAMVKGVEFTNLRILDREVLRMPALALHELAHAYHDRVLGHGHAGIKAAYERAKGAGLYDKVARWNGPGRTNTFERAYAIVNPQEYFAETTEAFFGRNDFFPFDREELKLHDPEMFELLKKVWGVTVAR